MTRRKSEITRDDLEGQIQKKKRRLIPGGGAGEYGQAVRRRFAGL
jgi:hypothetical protein